MDKRCHPDMIGVDGSDGSVDVVEIPDMVYQLWFVLNVTKFSFLGTGSVEIWISSTHSDESHG